MTNPANTVAICLCGLDVEATRDPRFAVRVYSCRCQCGMTGPHSEMPGRAAALFQANWKAALAAQQQAGMRAFTAGATA